VKIQHNISLKPYNSFGVEAFADVFIEANSVGQLKEILGNTALNHLPRLIVGGGSNMLFCNDFHGLVIKTDFQGIEVLEKGEEIFVKVGAGVVWNHLVGYCVQNGLGGIENLTLIPGSAGAAPIQNIGAYGVEVKDVFHELTAFEFATGEIRVFSKVDCKFGYRQSYFKEEGKGKFLITNITLKLTKNSELNTSYGAINNELDARGISNPTIADISKVVGDIRQSKLPDPTTIGNAGSFFKNPVLGNDIVNPVKAKFPDLVIFPMGPNHTKVAAGWLIENCGWKGKIIGNTGTWKNQALVLVNNGGATGQEVFDLSEKIIQSVKDKFGIPLEREVNIIR
jgi:UDP-N-acetylmuramate dehydrogenase